MPRLTLRPSVPSTRLSDIDLSPGESKTVGRGTRADMVINDPSFSRLHARLTADSPATLTIEDLGSVNGVFVNGIRQTRASVAVGDRVRFGLIEYVAGLADGHATAPEARYEPTLIRLPAAKDASSADRATLEALLATSRELMACSDLPALLEHVLDRLQTILKPDRSAILMVDATGTITPRAVRPRGAYTSLSEFASSTVVREALASHEVVLIQDPGERVQLRDAVSVIEARVQSAICVPLSGRAGTIGALYADRTGFSEPLTPELASVAAAFAGHAAAALETAQLYDDRERHFRGTLEAFARAIDARDPYTAGHSERVAAYTLTLARALGLADAELETIRRAGLLHDIGKVGVRDAILLKPGPLDPEERAAMEAHTVMGHRMLEGLPFLVAALPSIRGHHERWDGRGYPDGLAELAIHPHARLMALADTYDAMTSARPYRQALSREEAARRVRAEPGRQFEPAVVELFDRTEEEFDEIRTGIRLP